MDGFRSYIRYVRTLDTDSFLFEKGGGAYAKIEKIQAHLLHNQ